MLVGVLVLLAACARAAEAPDAQPAQSADEVFNSLYADRIKQAAATRDPKDDIALAGEIVRAARQIKNRPDFVARACREAYALAATLPDGFATALEAMDLLARQCPDQAGFAWEQSAAVLERQYAMIRGSERVRAAATLAETLLRLADARLAEEDPDAAVTALRRALAVATTHSLDLKPEIQQRLQSAVQRQQATARLRDLEKKVQADPADSAARQELVRLAIVELDNPGRASRYLDPASGDPMKNYVLVAAMSPDRLPEQACLGLARWYEGLAADAPPDAQPAMLRRAETYYLQFLNLHGADDDPLREAQAALVRVRAALEALGISTVGPWIECLERVDPGADVVEGTWTVVSNGLRVERGPMARLALPVEPKGEYELEVRFTRKTGANDLSVILPVGPTCTMLLTKPLKGGLELVAGSDWFQNPTQYESALPPGKTHTLHITVRQPAPGTTRITVEANDQALTQYEGPTDALSLRDSWALPRKGQLGLGAHYATVTFHSVRLRMLSGQAKFLR